MTCKSTNCNYKLFSDDGFCKRCAKLEVLEENIRIFYKNTTILTNIFKKTRALLKINNSYKIINIYNFVLTHELYYKEFEKLSKKNKIGLSCSEYTKLWKDVAKELFPQYDFTYNKDLNENIRQHFKFLGIGSLESCFDSNKVRSHFQSYYNQNTKPLWVCRQLYDHNHKNNYKWVSAGHNKWIWELIDENTPNEYKNPRKDLNFFEELANERRGGRRGKIICQNNSKCILKH